ncbi:DUF397 domain-containing protein [Embleya sp. NPDC059237]|uniref:DUF397 domain-containing protein n=1 Tax=Embleya sp. NPDC059237 TaxID=3346784 RepID=UPI0036C50491
MSSDGTIDVQWRKSSRSNGQGNCVETAVTNDGGRAVRDSKNRSGPTLRFTGDDWRAFIEGAKRGGFEAP